MSENLLKRCETLLSRSQDALEPLEPLKLKQYVDLLTDAFSAAAQAHRSCPSVTDPSCVGPVTQLYKAATVALATWYELFLRSQAGPSVDTKAFALWLVTDSVRIPLIRCFLAAEQLAIAVNANTSGPDVGLPAAELKELLATRTNKESSPSHETMTTPVARHISQALKYALFSAAAGGLPINPKPIRWDQVLGNSLVSLEPDEKNLKLANRQETSHSESVAAAEQDNGDEVIVSEERYIGVKKFEKAQEILTQLFSKEYGSNEPEVPPELASSDESIRILRLLHEVLCQNSYSEVAQRVVSGATSPTFLTAVLHPLIKSTQSEPLQASQTVLEEAIQKIPELLEAVTSRRAMRGLNLASIAVLVRSFYLLGSQIDRMQLKSTTRIMNTYTEALNSVLQNVSKLALWDNQTESDRKLDEGEQKRDNSPESTTIQASIHRIMEAVGGSSKATPVPLSVVQEFTVLQASSILASGIVTDITSLSAGLELYERALHTWLTSPLENVDKQLKVGQSSSTRSPAVAASLALSNLLASTSTNRDGQDLGELVGSIVPRVLTPELAGSLLSRARGASESWIAPVLNVLRSILLLNIGRIQTSLTKNQGGDPTHSDDEKVALVPSQDDKQCSGAFEAWSVSFLNMLYKLAKTRDLAAVPPSALHLLVATAVLRPAFAAQLVIEVGASKDSEDQLPPLLTLLAGALCRGVLDTATTEDIAASQAACIVLSLAMPRESIVLALICPHENEEDEELGRATKPHPLLTAMKTLAGRELPSSIDSGPWYAALVRVAAGHALAISLSNPSASFDIAKDLLPTLLGTLKLATRTVSDLIVRAKSQLVGLDTAQWLAPELVRIIVESLAFASTHIEAKREIIMQLRPVRESRPLSDPDEPLLTQLLCVLLGMPGKLDDSVLRATHCARYPFSPLPNERDPASLRFWEEFFLSDSTTRRSVLSLFKHLVCSEDSAKDEEQYAEGVTSTEVAKLREAAKRGIKGAAEKAQRERLRAGSENELVNLRKHLAVSLPGVYALLRVALRQILAPIDAIHDSGPYLNHLRHQCLYTRSKEGENELSIPPPCFLRLVRLPFAFADSMQESETSQSQFTPLEEGVSTVTFVIEKLATLPQTDVESRGKLVQFGFLQSVSQSFGYLQLVASALDLSPRSKNLVSRGSERIGVAIARILIHINPSLVSREALRASIPPLVHVGCNASHELFQFESFMALTNICALPESPQAGGSSFREAIYRGGIWKAARECLISDTPMLRRAAMQTWTNLITCPSSIAHFEASQESGPAANDRKLLLAFIQDADDVAMQSAAAGAIAMLCGTSPKAAKILAQTMVSLQGGGSQPAPAMLLIRALLAHPECDAKRVKPALNYALEHMARALKN